MRFQFAMLFALTTLLVTGQGLLAQDYLTKDGKLTKTLKVTQLQGGFAGFTGVEYVIMPDGSWKSGRVFNQKITPQQAGKLSQQEMAKLASLLKTNSLSTLPMKSGVQPGANPHILTFEFGKRKATLVGQVPPSLDAENPTGTVESRFAGLWQGVRELVNPPKKPKQK